MNYSKNNDELDNPFDEIILEDEEQMESELVSDKSYSLICIQFIKYYLARLAVAVLMLQAISYLKNMTSEAYMTHYHNVLTWMNLIAFPIACYSLGRIYSTFCKKTFKLKSVSYFSQKTVSLATDVILLLMYYGVVLGAIYFVFRFAILITLPFTLIYLFRIFFSN